MAMDDRLDRIGQQQYGLVTAAQLRGLGYSRAATHRLVETRRIAPVRLGVYRLCGTALSWRSVALAAVLSAGAGAVLSHRSAAVLWDLADPHHVAGEPLHITGAGQRRLEGVRAHRHALEAWEATLRLHIPVTTIERTLLDLAESEPAVVVGRMMDEALRRRLTTASRLERAARWRSGPGRRLAAPFMEALSDRGIGYDPGANPWEQAMDREWDRMGLPEALRQYRIRVADGRTYQPDRAILDARIAVDWNGYNPHGSRSSFDYDSDRRARLAAAGWFPLDFTSRSRPEFICRTVLAVYEARTGAPPPARRTSLPAS